MIMDIKEIIEDAREAGFLICNREYFGGADELLKFAELTLKRASLSAKGQDAWISVDDRLPESQVEVVFYAKPFEWFTGMFTPKGFFGREKHTFEYHQHWGDDGYHEIENVTHWMPLPEPPKANQTIANKKGGM
jgi:hypothetical protein